MISWFCSQYFKTAAKDQVIAHQLCVQWTPDATWTNLVYCYICSNANNLMCHNLYAIIYHHYMYLSDHSLIFIVHNWVKDIWNLTTNCKYAVKECEDYYFCIKKLRYMHLKAVFLKWASPWDYGTYHMGIQRRLRWACASSSLARAFANMKYGRRRRVRHPVQMCGCACTFEEWAYRGQKITIISWWLKYSLSQLNFHSQLCMWQFTKHDIAWNRASTIF